MSGVPGLAFKMILGGGLGIVRGVVTWLSQRSFAEIALIAVVAASLVIHLAEVRSLHKTEVQLLATSNALRKERLAHAADIARWKTASAAASANNRAKILQEQTHRAKTSEESSHDYQADLATLRAASRVRAASPVDQRRANGDGVSPVSIATGGPDAANRMLFSPDQLLRAQEIELQLMALQDWVRKQAAIDPNK